MKKDPEKSAFTLAEVLVTVGIIGVVAAILIPTMIRKIQDWQLKQAWKKEYSALAQAYERVKLDESGDLSADISTSGIDDFFAKIAGYIGFLEYCGHSGLVCGVNPPVVLGDKANNVYKTMSGGYLDNDEFFYAQFVARSGANFYARYYNNPSSGPWYDNPPVNIWVDVNGFGKKPNILGKDLFGVVITKHKIVPMGAQHSGTGIGKCRLSDNYIPSGSSTQASDYIGTACSMTILSE